jgi:hypothetical protein
LEEGRIEIGHAQYLAPIREPELIDRLLEQAALPRDDFIRLARSVVQNNTQPYCADDGRLVDIEGKLARIRTLTPIGLQVLDRIIARAVELRGAAQAARGAGSTSTTGEGATGVDATS